jgi:methyl-accepting chemotaxis protein
MYERYGDIQTIAGLEAFANPKVQAATSRQEKQVLLDRYVQAHKMYASIAVFDLKGDVIAQSKGESLKNHSDRDYFQAALKTDRAVISQPTASKSTGVFSVYNAAPVKDTSTGKTIAIVRTRMPVEALDEILKTEETRLAEINQAFAKNEYYLADSAGKFFVAKAPDRVGKSAQSSFPVFTQMQAANKPAAAVAVDQAEGEGGEELVSFAPVQQLEGMPQLNWSVLNEGTDIVFAAERRLLLTLLVETGLTALLVAAIAAYLADRATRPILSATTAVGKLGQGELDTRVAVTGEDELATLGSNINQMADQLQDLLRRQEAETERAQQLSAITLHIRESLELESILNEATKDIRAALQTDRVVVYRLNEQWEGNIITESVGSGWPVAKGVRIDDPCIKDRQAEAYRKGRVRAINNIHQAPDLTECYIQQLEQFEVKANLVAPLLVDDELFGLLIAHQCSGPRNWQQTEIDLFTQLATQVGLALEQANLLEQVEQSRQQTEVIAQEQRQQKELLQRRMIELLIEVDPVSQGDLTIRAQVTPDEVGTIADSYNSIIGSLRQTVQQVQTAAQAVSQNAQGNETTVQALSQDALRQAEAITGALDQIQLMASSVQRVALNAHQAEIQAQQANQTVQVGDEAMNRTVAGISAIRETVAETAKKVKRLGEASQKISRVVSLIGTFANRTNLLSLNAAIEAARAGEEGRGFAVVAEEVRSLAQQSTAATTEIEQLVEDIQMETNEVVTAMETGTDQVVTGTQLVEETRQKLSQIAIASTQISTLVEGIAEAAAVQTQTSASVSQTIQEVAAIADQTSEKSVGVAGSFTQLLAVAQELQVGMAQFKVN